MSYDVSIIIPGIRPELWSKVYRSIASSCTKSWEVIFVGPADANDMFGLENVKFIKSHASPMVCRQKALLAAKGDWICYAADDCTFLPDSLNIALEKAGDVRVNPNNVIVGKYLEDVDEVKLDNPLMRQDPYWFLNFHTGLHSILRPFMKNYYLINTGLVSRKLMLEIGGFDCQFEACAMACVDLSLRLQIFGAKCILQNEPIFKSTHLPGHAGDHGPIHDAQTQHDEPLFFRVWGDIAGIRRTVIDVNNYTRYDVPWQRRFGNVKA